MWIVSRLRDLIRSWREPRIPAAEKELPNPQMLAAIRAKSVRTQREELILARGDFTERRSDGAHRAIRLEKLNDASGTLYLLFPDSDTHEARIQPAIKGGYDRLFWANLMIACDGPDQLGKQSSTTSLHARNFGKLQYAANDLDAFYQYYRPMRLGDIDTVIVGGIGKSPGFFDITKRLMNPTIEDIDRAVRELRQWIEINSDDPEFVSVQINLLYAGHGSIANGESGFIVGDGFMSSRQMAMRILSVLNNLSKIESTCRLDLYLDCCHSAAIARDMTKTLTIAADGHGSSPSYTGPRIGLGKVYCSCLDDEHAVEHDEVAHGLFTFAFLNEMSRRIPDGARHLAIGLRDIGWFSDLRQHPMLLDFTNHKTSPDVMPRMRFPCVQVIGGEVAGQVFDSAQRMASEEAIANAEQKGGELVVSPLDYAVSFGRVIRDACVEKEREIRHQPSRRRIFSRKEVARRDYFWT
ncbi:MAG: hypothetical protein U1A77_00015 [Pirellulales bacterium]